MIGLDKLLVCSQQQGIVILQRHVLPVAIKQDTTSVDGMDMRSIMTIEVELSQGLPYARETASKHNLDKVNTSRLVFLFVMLCLTHIGQEVVTIKYKVCEADYADDDAYLT